MGNTTPNLGELYKYIMRNAQLEEFRVEKDSPKLGPISFYSIDRSTMDFVLPRLEMFDSAGLSKGGFLLDTCLLTLLARQGGDRLGDRVIGLDVRFQTLFKQDSRTRYLPQLADFLRGSELNLLLNICEVPPTAHANQLTDQLRYALAVTRRVTVELNEALLCAQELSGVAAGQFSIKVTELSDISQSSNRRPALARINSLMKTGKELIVRNDTQLHTKNDIAYYL